MTDRDGLWFRVLVVRYGVEGGWLRKGAHRFCLVAADGSYSEGYWWAMGQTLSFGQIGGWVEMCLVFGFGISLSYLRKNWLRCRIWLG